MDKQCADSRGSPRLSGLICCRRSQLCLKNGFEFVEPFFLSGSLQIRKRLLLLEIFLIFPNVLAGVHDSPAKSKSMVRTENRQYGLRVSQ